MTECDEIAANMALPDRRLSFDEALAVVRAQMPDESATVVANVAESLMLRSRRAVRFMLVYQTGIANLFAVQAFGLTPQERGDTKRHYQGDFRTAEATARGAELAGAVVRCCGCNRAGDIASADWESDLGPFRDSTNPAANWVIFD